MMQHLSQVLEEPMEHLAVHKAQEWPPPLQSHRNQFRWSCQKVEQRIEEMDGYVVFDAE